MRIIGIFSIILMISIKYGHSQSDSSLVSFETFMEIVKINHPVTRQADLLRETGKANLKKAKGNFDPVLKSAYDRKQFDDKNYYQLNTNEIKIPTSVGIELKAGYDNNQGLFVNPENQLPDNGLAYAGIVIPIGKGLLFDERRQAVRQAEVYERATELERTLMINQLIFDAAKAYWEWYSAWNTYRIFDEAVQLADFRFKGIKQSFFLGDLPAIDTLEAYILVQNRQLSRNEAYINMQKAKLEASNFLWSEELEPMMLTDNSEPTNHKELSIENPIDENILASIISDVDQSHPKMQLYYNKLENLHFERKMKAEKIKPKLNFNYNMLNQPVGNNPFEGFSTNDFKWGFEFSMPLFLRGERGDLQLTKLKINQTDMVRQQESLEISNKIMAYKVELNNLFDQIALFKNAVENYRAMLNGEQRKFEEGESSLFLVNSRETSLITAEVKLIEILAKYKKARAGLIQAIGGQDLMI